MQHKTLAIRHDTKTHIYKMKILYVHKKVVFF